MGVAGWDLASFPGMSRGTICRWVCLPSCLRSAVGLAPGERNITRCGDRRRGAGGRRADSGVQSSAPWARALQRGLGGPLAPNTGQHAKLGGEPPSRGGTPLEGGVPANNPWLHASPSGLGSPRGHVRLGCASEGRAPLCSHPIARRVVSCNYLLTHHFPPLDCKLFEGRKLLSSIFLSPANAQ